MKKWTSFLLLLGWGTIAHAQVQNRMYNTLLKSLLSHSVKELSVKEAAPMWGKAVFLDARERKEYEVSHIKGAHWIGYDDYKRSRLPKVSKSTPIVVYCSVGYRSEKITEKLLQDGYTEVYNLYGGVFEWVNQGHPVYVNGKRTQQVHAFDRKWGVWLKKGERVYN